MKQLFHIFMLCLALCASKAQGQDVFVSGSFGESSRYALFGNEQYDHGLIGITTTNRVRLNSLQFKVRECSTWDQPTTPFFNFQISNGTTSVHGKMEVVSGETLVTFPVNATLPVGRIGYSITSSVADFASFSSANQKCFRMALDQSGIDTSGSVSGNFPVRLRASTLVLAEPTVSITTIGQTIERVRQTTDDVFRVNVVNPSNNYAMWIKGLRLRFTGSALPTNATTFSLVDPETGFVVATGHYYSSGNVVWKEIVGGISYEQYALPASATRQYVIRVNSSDFNDSPNGSDSFSVQIVSPCDLRWDTTVSNDSGPGLCAPSTRFPITGTVSYE